MTFSLTINCPHCGQPNHTPDCPIARIESLAARQKHLLCPACGVYDVDVNTKDLYECRSCHTQFSCNTDPIIDPPKDCRKVLLVIDEDAHPSSGIITVWQYKTKGEGRFPIDDAINKLFREEL